MTSTFQEPVVGWIDNLYGPTGVVAGAGSGVLRTMYEVQRAMSNETFLMIFLIQFRHCDKNINANIVPVDMTVNALIVAAQDAGMKKSRHNSSAMEKLYEIPIYNYVSSVQNPLTWGEFTDLNIEYGFDYPFSSAIW